MEFRKLLNLMYLILEIYILTYKYIPVKVKKYISYM